MILFPFLFLSSLSLATEPFREWTNLDGRTITAHFIEERQEQVSVRRTDGRTFKIHLDQLSKEDRKYVKSLSFDHTVGLVAWYPFNGNARDESGNGHHGEVYGAKLCKDRKGKEDSAYSFSMRRERINLGNSSKLNPKSEMTVSAWIIFGPSSDYFEKSGRFGSPIVARYFGGKGDSKSYLFRINHDRTLGAFVYNKVISKKSATGSSPYHSKRVIAHGSSHFLAFSFKANDGGSLFGDGEVLTSIDILHVESYILQSRTNTMIGAFSNFSNPDFMSFNGVIDDVRIYDRALSRDEIKSLYELEN